jgi:hypothetical protein
MSEKPVASIKTLARYEPEAVYIGTGEYVAECVRADDGDYYLATDVDAATEALLAEVDALREALKDLITWFPSAGTYRRLGFDPEAPMRAFEKARAALKQEKEGQ